MELKNIAVVGPAGNLGSQIVKRLLADNHFKVTAIVRPSSAYAPQPGVNKATADFEDSTSLTKALHGQDALVCLVPGPQTRLGPQRLLIDSAIKAGVKLYFASEYAANILDPHFKSFPAPLVGDKVEIRKYLEEKAAAGEIAYTALNGGPILDMWLNKSFTGFDIQARKAKIYGSGNVFSCWTQLPVYADTIVSMLRIPDKIRNRGIYISGIQGVTQNAILEALEAETGARFVIEHAEITGVKTKALEALRNGQMGLAMMGLHTASNFDPENAGFADFWDKVENDLVGVKPVTVREAVKEVMKEKGLQ